MGGTCCKPSSASPEDEQTEDGFVSGETLIEMLENRTSTELPTTKRKADGGVLINLDLVETILLEKESDEEGADEVPQGAQPAVTKASVKPVKGRKATGFLTKEQVESALTRSEQGGVSFADEPVEADAASAAAPAGKAPESKARKRKPTGFVTKEKLLQALQDVGEDEDEEEGNLAKAVAKPAPAPTRGGKRKGTGFVSKKQLQKVMDAFGED